MCGICGVIAPSTESEPAVRAMQRRLAHRGPDAEGLASLPSAILGHRRLSIIDLSPLGAQPMWDVTHSACIAFNGEIYNFLELRAECIRRGREFRGHSDTEVILNLYLLDGPASFARLDGMFAFCLVDCGSGASFLVRDPMGVKPLYYADLPVGLFFASELGALVESGVVGSEIDSAALQAYLRLDYVPSPMCLIRGVKKLVAGEVLRVDASGRRTVETFAKWDDGTEVDESPESALARFDELIHAAVRRQLVADVPVGIFLSGGIDSSIVAAVAAEVSDRTIHTFSIGFDEPTFDESRWFDEVARAVGSEHHTEIVDARRALELVPRVAEITSEPVADGSIFPTYLLCAFARKSVKVALSGDGADELFGGYPTYAFRTVASLLSDVPAPARRAAFAMLDTLLPVSYENLTTGYKMRKFLDGLDPNPVLRNQRWLGTFSRESLPRLMVRHDPGADAELERLLLQPAARVAGRPVLERLLRTDQRFYMQDQVLVKSDRASMACSLEIRPPFLSEPIVRFARSLGEDLKVWRGSHKRILRDWVARRLSADIARRPKKGFGAPLGKWFRGELRDLVADNLSPARIKRQGLLRAEEVTRLVDDHLRGCADRRKELFNLLSLQLWIESLEQRRLKANSASLASIDSR